MPVTRRHAALIALVLLPLAAILLASRLLRSLEADPVLTFEVRPGPFVREVQARGSLRAVKATPILVPAQARRSQKVAFLAKDGSRLAKGDVVVEFDPTDAEREAADSRSDLTAARAKIDKARADGSKSARALAIDRDVARADLARADQYELSDESLYSRNQIIESRLSRELAATQVEVSGAQLDASARLSAAERSLGEIDAGKASFKLDMARKSLDALRITAPHDGLLVLQRNWRGETTFVGDTLWPGQKVAELPELAPLEARVFVLEADGAGLAPGLGARVSIEGRPGQEYAAKVARVEPLAKTTEWQSPVRYFEAVLSLDATDPAFMRPGQRVRAMVRLEEAADVLAIPRGALFERDGKRVVYRQQAGGFVPVPVKIGRQSVSRVVIDSGLGVGDRVALRDPDAKAATKRPPSAAAGPGR